MNHEPQHTAGELWLEQAVVTAGELADQLAGVGQLVVRRGAVITPAARDLLRERKIGLTYQAGPAAAAGQATLIVGVANVRFEPGELLRTLAREPIAIERLTTGGLFDLVEQMNERVTTDQTLAVLFTEETAAAVCLANRRAGVRAVAAADCRGVVASVRSVGANLLAIDPNGRSVHELNQMVSRFCRGTPRRCPEIWQGRL